MEEQVQGGVCGGNFWVDRPTKFFLSSSINGPKSFGWPSHDRATGSLSGDSAGSVLHEPSPENVSVVSTLEMMGINLSPSTTLDDDNWNQDLIHESQKSQENYSHNLQASSAPLGLVDPGMNIDGQNLGFQYNTNSLDYKLPLLQTLLDVGPNRQSIPNIHQSTNYGPSQNYVSRAEFCSTLPDNVQETRHANDRFEFANNCAPFWNASTSSFAASSRLIRPTSLHNSRPNFHILDSKQHNYQEAGQGSKKAGHKPAAKRPPAENPSPLSAFKVRKEKLGDRITALQQLVSPFGKTDTASVLHEAIEYIKFLHDQVSVLSTPYLKNGSPQLQYQQAEDKIKDAREQIEDLKSRGLCLVPVSTTFPVATETNTYFWAPTFGECFK